jgi:hypothetical protein
MINETSGKIVIEANEDKRLEVAIELAKTVNNLSEMLKTMETSISNIHINGCNIQTAQGETAIQMGNGVKNSVISNSIFQTDYPTSSLLNFSSNEDEDDFNSEMFDSKEEQDEWRINDLMLKPADSSENEDEEPYDEAYEEGIQAFYENEKEEVVEIEDPELSKLKKAFEIVKKDNQKYERLVDAIKDIFESENE